MAKTLQADSRLRVVDIGNTLAEQPIVQRASALRGHTDAKAKAVAGVSPKRARNGKSAKAKKKSRSNKSASSDKANRLANGFKIVANAHAVNEASIASVDIRASIPAEIQYKQLFTRFEAAFLSADIDAIAACLSPAFQWHLPNGMVVYGKTQSLAEMQRRFSMPNGPKFSDSVWRFKGSSVIQTYNVSYLGPDGKWRDSLGMDLYEIGDGLITRKDAYWKMIP